jgi:NADPH:quinone reductase-like Zn-dependent oxidoreductase
VPDSTRIGHYRRLYATSTHATARQNFAANRQLLTLIQRPERVHRTQEVGGSTGLVRAGGTLVAIAGPPEARPGDGRAVDFVVVPDRAQLSEVVRRVRDGRLRTIIGNVSTLDEAVAAFNPTERIKGKTIIRVRP